MTIEERMAKLERQVRRMKWAVLILGVALVVGIGWRSRVLSPTPAHGQNRRIVEAEEFRVVDENGKVRVLLSVSKDTGDLSLLDENGEVRAMLSTGNKVGTSLILRDQNDKIRVGLFVFRDTPVLTFFGENEEPRAVLGVRKDRPDLILYDATGKVSWFAPP